MGHVRQRHDIGKVVNVRISDMSAKFHNQTELSDNDLGFLDEIMLPHNTGRSFVHLQVIDELIAIIDGDPAIQQQNYKHKQLTLKYYARKAIRHVKHRVFLPVWQQYSENEESLSHEDVLIMISQWCQPTVEVAKIGIRSQLDKLAADALSALAAKSCALLAKTLVCRASCWAQTTRAV